MEVDSYFTYMNSKRASKGKFLMLKNQRQIDIDSFDRDRIAENSHESNKTEDLQSHPKQNHLFTLGR